MNGVDSSTSSTARRICSPDSRSAGKVLLFASDCLTDVAFIRTPAQIVPGPCASFHEGQARGIRIRFGIRPAGALILDASCGIRKLVRAPQNIEATPRSVKLKKPRLELSETERTKSYAGHLRLTEGNFPKNVEPPGSPRAKSGTINNPFSIFQRWKPPSWLTIGSFGRIRTTTRGNALSRV